MRIVVLTILIVLSLPLVVGQTKEDKQRLKEQEKEMLGRAPEVEIQAAVDPVKAILVRKMTATGWEIESDSQFQVAFSRAAETTGEVWGLMLGAQMRGDDPSLPTIHVRFAVTPLERCKTVVRFSTSLSYSVKGGRTLTSENGGMKTYKPRLLGVLDDTKYMMEQQPPDLGLSPCPNAEAH